MVLIISVDFYDQYLFYIEIYFFDEVLYIECVDGQNMFYLGYIFVSIKFYGILYYVLEECLFLIVFNSNYNVRVFVFIGINIISCFIDLICDEFGIRYL